MNIHFLIIDFLFYTMIAITWIISNVVNGQNNFFSCPSESLTLTQIGNDLVSGSAGDFFGLHISLSNHGNVLAVGAYGNDVNGEYSGAVFVFERNNYNEWIQKGLPLYGENAYEKTTFNTLSDDGSIIAISSERKDDAGNDAGKVRVFQFVNNNWVQIGLNINGLQKGERFGWGLDLSGDGTILAVGAQFAGVNDEGHVRVFQYNNITNRWVQRGSTINGGGDGATLRELSLSQNGIILAVGAPAYNSAFIDAGSVRIFQYIINDWQQLGQTLLGRAAEDRFGNSIILSPDGKEITIAASPTVEANKQGYVTAYIYEGVSWVQQGQTLLSEQSGNAFGDSMSRSGDGKILVVGSPKYDASGTQRGLAQVFYRQDSNWIQIFGNILGKHDYQSYGTYVAVSKDGSTIAIGGSDSHNTSVSGIVQVFEINCDVIPPLVPISSPTSQPINPPTFVPTAESPKSKSSSKFALGLGVGGAILFLAITGLAACKCYGKKVQELSEGKHKLADRPRQFEELSDSTGREILNCGPLAPPTLNVEVEAVSGDESSYYPSHLTNKDQCRSLSKDIPMAEATPVLSHSDC